MISMKLAERCEMVSSMDFVIIKLIINVAMMDAERRHRARRASGGEPAAKGGYTFSPDEPFT